MGGDFYNPVMHTSPFDPSAFPTATEGGEHQSNLSDSPLLANLNVEQLAAVTLPAEHALVLAGAGSGKTRVLTTRIAWLLQTGQISSSGVLAVTFTNKAAREMVARLSAMLSLRVQGMWIGTFHGLCNRFLRAHHTLAHLPAGFQVLDVQDQLSAIKRLCKQFGVDTERYAPKVLQGFISANKEDGLRPEAVPAKDLDTRKKLEVYRLYEEQCQREGVVDFGELILRSYELLRDHASVREHYRRRFAHVLIDEFQDTNRLQYEWIKMLVGAPGGESSGGCILAVGDDDQSIYAFRGARVGNMFDFVREFGVQHHIKLEENYRSGSHILDCANALIGHNRERLGKNLRTSQGTGEMVRVFEATPNGQHSGDFIEAAWIVEEIRHLADGGWPLREIAVLYRSNAQSRVIESALVQVGISYRVYGGLRFFDRAEIKNALAYLRLIENPHDDTSFLRVVNFPPRGIGLRTLEQLQDVAQSRGCALSDAASALDGRPGRIVQTFVDSLHEMRSTVQGLRLGQVVERVLDRSGVLEHYRNDREGADRVANLEELVHAAEGFAAAEGLDPIVHTDLSSEEPSVLALFLTQAALEAGDNTAQSAQEGVQLMTVHSSKGLEFDAVFLTGLEEGLFPHDNALSDRAGLEEERRLMYVAITRARSRLVLSHAQTRMLHGQTRYNLRSRFLDELPEHAVRWITARKAASPSAPMASSRQPVAPTAQRPAQDEAGLRVGQKVFHNHFGEGEVLRLDPQAGHAQVSFTRHGVKWLALAIAKLTPVD